MSWLLAFFASALAILPLAVWMGRATERAAARAELGRSDWPKGVQLLAVYVILGPAYSFLPARG